MSKHPQAHAEIQAAFDALQPDAIQLEYVQVRIGEVTTCATIADTWRTADGVDFYKLNLLVPYVGPAHFPVCRIRQCSRLDGRCYCAGEVGAAPAQGPRLRGLAGAQATCAPALPDGNHGDNDFSVSTPATTALDCLHP